MSNPLPSADEESPGAPVAAPRRAGQQLARGGVASLAGAAVSAVANFALVVVIAHYVTQAQAGIFFGATSLFLIVETLLRLGADVGVVYFLARWKALDTPERVRPTLVAALAPVAIGCIAAAVAMALLAPWLADLIGDDRHTSVGLLRLLAAVLPVAALYDVAIAATRGLGRMGPTVVIEKILRPVAQVVLAAIVLLAGSVAGLGPAWALPYVAAAVLTAWSLQRALRRLGHAARPTAQQVRDSGHVFWAFTLPRAVAGAAQIVLQRLDIVLVAALRGPRDAAIYTAATRFLVLGQFVSQAIAAPVQPRLSAAVAGRDRALARELYQVSTTWIVLLSWPMFATVAVYASFYVGLFGPGYRSGIPVVVLLALAMLVAAAVGVVDAVLLMAGRTTWNLATTLGALVVDVVLDLLLIPHLGIIGAAIGWAGAILVANVVPLGLAWRGLDLHPYGPASLPAFVLSASCFAGLPGLGLAVGGPALAGAGTVIGLAVFVSGVWRWRELFDLTALRHLRRRPAGLEGTS